MRYLVKNKLFEKLHRKKNTNLEEERVTFKDPVREIILLFPFPLKNSKQLMIAPKKLHTITNEKFGINEDEKNPFFRVERIRPQEDKEDDRMLKALVTADKNQETICINVEKDLEYNVLITINDVNGNEIFREVCTEKKFEYIIETSKWNKKMKEGLKILKIRQYPPNLDPGDKSKVQDRRFRINRRVSYKLCVPLLRKFEDSIYYCCLAKLPGVWIASSILQEHKPHFDRTKKKDGKIVKYDEEKHAADTSLKHLTRKELEPYLGKCRYTLTRYGRLLRIAIPYEDDFMVILNAKIKHLQSFQELIERIWVPTTIPNLIPDKEYHTSMIDLCNAKADFFEKEKIFSTREYVRDFFATNPKLPNFHAAFRAFFDKKQKSIAVGLVEKKLEKLRIENDNLEQDCKELVKPESLHEYKNDLKKITTAYEKFFESSNEDQNTNLLNNIKDVEFNSKNFILDNEHEIYKQKRLEIRRNAENIKRQIKLTDILGKIDLVKDEIRYAALGDTDGIPYFRYVKKGVNLLLNTHDEYELFIDAVNRQKMRKDTSEFFEGVKFTLTLYSKVAEMTIPLGPDHILIVSLKLNQKTKKFLMPPTMENIIEFLENDVNKDYVLSDLR